MRYIPNFHGEQLERIANALERIADGMDADRGERLRVALREAGVPESRPLGHEEEGK
jgi:hypothetical protein